MGWIGSMWTLEPCRFCRSIPKGYDAQAPLGRGSGVMGTISHYQITCEACDGSGLDWTERCTLW